MPSDFDWEDIVEDYNYDLFDQDLYYFGDPKSDIIFTTDSESQAMDYIIDNTDYFELQVYDKTGDKIYDLFRAHPMESSFLTSDKFVKEYSNSLYTFIERIPDCPFTKDDIAGVIIYPKEGRGY